MLPSDPQERQGGCQHRSTISRFFDENDQPSGWVCDDCDHVMLVREAPKVGQPAPAPIERPEGLKLIEVAAAVIEKDGLFRIFRRGGDDSYTGKWEFPGGKLEPGESPRDALRREIKEELCVDCVVGEELDHYWYKYPKRSPISLRFFAVELLGSPEFTEHTESVWARAEELTSYDLMNADMKFVATRLALEAEVTRLRADKERIANHPAEGEKI